MNNLYEEKAIALEKNNRAINWKKMQFVTEAAAAAVAVHGPVRL